MWQSLIAVLTSTLALCENLTELGGRKKAALVAVDTAALALATKQEEKFLAELNKLEARRAALMAELAAARGEAGETDFRRFAAWRGGADGRRLEALYGRLQEAAAACGRLNRANDRLLKQALAIVDFNVNVLAQTTVGPTYGPRQGGQQAVTRKMFDHKV